MSACLNGIKYIFGACYRPPDSRSEFIDHLTTSLEEVTSKFPNSIIILAVDFNYPAIDWSTLSNNVPNKRVQCVHFLHLMQLFQLTQLVLAPAHGDHRLDLVLTNNPDNASVHILGEISDHNIIHGTLPLPRPDKTTFEKCILDYAHADEEKNNEMLAAFWPNFHQRFNTRTTNENWTLFCDKLKEIERACVPKLIIRAQAGDPWFTHEVEAVLNKKKRCYRKATRSGKPEDFVQYKEVAGLLEAKISEAKNKFFNFTLCSMLQTNPKKFWRTINPKCTTKIPFLESNIGTPLTDVECAVRFNLYFSGLFTTEQPLGNSITTEQIPIAFPDVPVVVTENGVARAIDRLPHSTCPGPDGISSKLLKFPRHLSTAIHTLIFQQSIDTGCIPEDWKFGHVVPIYNSGDSAQPSNYHPISLTTICCKLLEHILYHHIMAHLNKNNLLFENQHGFRSERSCQTQLFELLNDLHRSFHSSRYVDAIFIDYSKAFERVPHKRLQLKLSALQLDSRTTEWIEGFLTNRFQ